MEVFLGGPRNRRGGANIDEGAAEDVDEVLVLVLDVVVGVIVEPWRVVLRITPWMSEALLPGRNDFGEGISVQNVDTRVASSMMKASNCQFLGVKPFCPRSGGDASAQRPGGKRGARPAMA